MAWLEAHQSLSGHPKTRKAARLLSISRPQLIGHLFCLWWWAIDYAPDGDVSGYDADDLALAAEWEGEAATFVHALEECRYGGKCGFLERTVDGRLLIHDWWEYAGKLIQRRELDRERKRQGRQPDAPPDIHDAPSINSTPVQRISNGHPTDGAQTAYVQTDRPTDSPQTNRHTTNQPTDQPVLAPDAIAPDAVALPVGSALALSKPQRACDPIFDVFLDIFADGDSSLLSDPERGKWNTAAKGFRAIAVKKDLPLEHMAALIRQAHDNWPNVKGALSETPNGLLTDFATLLKGPQVRGRSNGTVTQHKQTVTEYAAINRGPKRGSAALDDDWRLSDVRNGTT